MSELLHLRGLGAVVDVQCTGEASALLASAMRQAWSRCLDNEGVDAEGLIPAPPVEVHLDDAGELTSCLMKSTQDITRALITAQCGRLLMLHAGSVSHPETGESLVFVAPGGTGKTTLSQRLATRLGYITDETVGIDGTGAILPYPKPLSVRRADESSLKDELSPDTLGLLPAPASTRVARVVLLYRDPAGPAVNIEELRFMDALFSLSEQTSSLSRLARPLHRLADLIDRSGPVLRVQYAEAAEVETELAELIQGAA